MLRKLGSRVIDSCISQICCRISHESYVFVDIRSLIHTHYIIHKLAPHGISKIKIFAEVNAKTTKLDAYIFQSPFWLPTENYLDKWHNQYMDIW